MEDLRDFAASKADALPRSTIDLLPRIAGSSKHPNPSTFCYSPAPKKPQISPVLASPTNASAAYRMAPTAVETGPPLRRHGLAVALYPESHRLCGCASQAK